MALPALVGLVMVSGTSSRVSTQSVGGSQLTTPVFHHVHQNSTDPAAAIAGFQKIYPGLIKVTVGGFDGVQIPSVISILFTKVYAPAPTEPQSAFLRHVFSVPDVRELVTQLRSRNMDVRPLYTLEGTTVDVSADTYQNGMTRTSYEEAKAKGTLAPPTKTGGYIIFWGPEHVLMETTERNTLKPGGSRQVWWTCGRTISICAELWYRTT